MHSDVQIPNLKNILQEQTKKWMIILQPYNHIYSCHASLWLLEK
jgi:hypothetical protein